VEQGPDERESWLQRRGSDFVIWVLVIAALLGFASGAAWLLSNIRLKLDLPDAADGGVYEERPASTPPADAIPGAPPSAGPNGEVVRTPVWVRPPAPEFPELAMRRGIEQGSVTLRCKATASGRVGPCAVLNESPADAGFAEAAVAAARDARVEPRTVDGVRTDSMISYRVRFRIG